METIRLKEIMTSTIYEVNHAKRDYRFQYDYELGHDQWRVDAWNDEEKAYDLAVGVAEGKYGRIEAAVRSYFGLDYYDIFENYNQKAERAFRVRAGSYQEASDATLKVLGYRDVLHAGSVEGIEFVYDDEFGRV